MNCLQMQHHFWGVHFPPGTNPSEMQLTGFTCGWFSSWPLVINLQAEAEASVSLSHVAYRLCDSAYMILALPLLSEMTLVNECHVLSSIAGDSYTTRRYWSACVHSFSKEVRQDLHPWLFWVWGNLSVPYACMILAHYHSCRNCCGLLPLASDTLHSKVSVLS